MAAFPTKLMLDSAGALVIEWSDGQTRRYTTKELRDHCPCASCRERRAAASTPLLPILSAAEARPLAILGMEPVGHYAYSIQFSDGHNTGIYTLELLHSLGEPLSQENREG